MRVVGTDIPDVKMLVGVRHGDHRGWFTETWREDTLRGLGIDARFVQDNASYSADRGTVRGLHFQLPPRAQGKLVRVARGAIFDVAVDLRQGSPTFGRHVTARLSAEACNQMWIPAGFAHGLCTLEPDTEIQYKVTDTYSPEHDRGLAWDDPDLQIPWPAEAANVRISAKDAAHPRLRDLPVCFPRETP
jgi:dTDP-4-dehydrorhamnose 3,5-epimerase